MFLQHLIIGILAFGINILFLKIILILIYLYYIVCDIYIYSIINNTAYISKILETDDTNTEYNSCYHLREYYDACDCKLSMISQLSIITVSYKIIKTVVYPIEYIYNKSNIINIPYVIHYIDKLYWYIITVCFNIMVYIINNTPLYRLKKIIINYVVSKITTIAFQNLPFIINNIGLKKNDKKELNKTMHLLQKNMYQTHNKKDDEQILKTLEHLQTKLLEISK